MVTGLVNATKSFHSSSFPSEWEAGTGTGFSQAGHDGVSIQVVFPASGKSSFREPYGDWVSAAKSTHLQKSYHILLKTEPNTYLKPSPCKASTHLNEKHRVWAIC